MHHELKIINRSSFVLSAVCLICVLLLAKIWPNSMAFAFGSGSIFSLFLCSNIVQYAAILLIEAREHSEKILEFTEGVKND